MKPILIVLISSLVLSSFAFEFLQLKQMFQAGGDLPTVDQVDINQYQGQWYEIARLPNIHQINCICAQHEVILQDNKIFANDTCLRGSILGKQDFYDYEMIPLDDSYAKFKTDIVPDYYIIALDQEDYEYAMIADPSRDFLWIVSRNATIDKDQLLDLVKQAQNLGFDVDNLEYEAQICGNLFQENMALQNQFKFEEEEQAEAEQAEAAQAEEEEEAEEEQAEEEEEEEEEEQQQDLPTVDQVDLNRFIGHWYEIARLPIKQERGCLCTQENLQLQGANIHVEAICRKNDIDAEITRCQHNLIPEDQTNAKFNIQNENIELYVVDLDEDNYQYVLIADPERRYLWIKSRLQLVDYDILKQLIDKARNLGFDVDNLVYTAQLCGNDFENEQIF